MKFIQTIEFRGTKERFDELVDVYREAVGDEGLARRATLCADRDHPGTLVQVVEFDSWDDAQTNNELRGTQQLAEKAQDVFGDAVYRNLDVLEVYEL